MQFTFTRQHLSFIVWPRPAQSKIVSWLSSLEHRHSGLGTPATEHWSLSFFCCLSKRLRQFQAAIRRYIRAEGKQETNVPLNSLTSKCSSSWLCNGYWTKVAKYPPEWVQPMRGIFNSLSLISRVFNRIFCRGKRYFAEVIMSFRAVVCHFFYCWSPSTIDNQIKTLLLMHTTIDN